MKKLVAMGFFTLITLSNAFAQTQARRGEKVLFCYPTGFHKQYQSAQGSSSPLSVTFLHPQGFRFVALAFGNENAGYTLHTYSIDPASGRLLKFVSTPSSFIYFEGKKGVIIGCRLN